MKKPWQPSSTTKNDHIILSKKAVKKHVTVFVSNTNTLEKQLHAYPWKVQPKGKIISVTTGEQNNLEHSQHSTLTLSLFVQPIQE